MAGLSFSINQDDGLNIWIKQTLQDELTGAEFSKLENALKDDFFQNKPISDLVSNIYRFFEPTSGLGGFLADRQERDRGEIRRIEQKARNILIEKTEELDASGLRAIFGENVANDEQNNAIRVMKFFLAGKDFRAIKEWLDSSSSNEIENELLGKITAALKKGLEECPILAVIGGHNVTFSEEDSWSNS